MCTKQASIRVCASPACDPKQTSVEYRPWGLLGGSITLSQTYLGRPAVAQRFCNASSAAGSPPHDLGERHHQLALGSIQVGLEQQPCQGSLDWLQPARQRQQEGRHGELIRSQVP